MTSITAQKKLKLRVGGDDFINQVPRFYFSPSNRNLLVYGILTWAITRNLIPLELYNFLSYQSRIPKTLKTKVGWLIDWLIYRSSSSGNKTYSNLNLLGAKIWPEWIRGCLQAPFTQPRLVVKMMCWIFGSTQTLLVMACSAWYMCHVTFQKPNSSESWNKSGPKGLSKEMGALYFSSRLPLLIRIPVFQCLVVGSKKYFSSALTGNCSTSGQNSSRTIVSGRSPNKILTFTLYHTI